MNNTIKLLSESVANQIAAGEVVQRPASVVKELVENAIDANATQIDISVIDAGRTSIQVVDNGTGMSASDACLSFERHATSKIHATTDLFALSTFGFRGEALASIAAVADVELKTRLKTDDVGIKIIMRASEFISQEQVVCSIGCSLTVRNLFFNIPARRKFLKSNQTEFRHIIREIERIAIAHPEVRISLSHQGEEVLNLPASPIKSRLITLFGSKMNKNLLPVRVSTSIVTISGYVGTIGSVRKKGSKQFFFVNGRYIRHFYFHKAVLEPYINLVQVGEQPSYFIFLEISPDCIDVNIHPTKTEVKFTEENAIWQILYSAVKESVGKYEGVPTIDFDTEGMPDIPLYDGKTYVSPPKVNYNPEFNPFSQLKPAGSRKDGEWSVLFNKTSETRLNEADTFLSESLPASTYKSIISEEQKSIEEKRSEPEQIFDCIQYKQAYIVTKVTSGVMIVDQRSAHIRILYEYYLDKILNNKLASQGLLFPEMYQLSMADAAALADLMDDFIAVGFDISNMGHGAIAVHGVPNELEGRDYEKLIVEMIHSAIDDGVDNRERQREAFVLSLAKSAAINGETKLDVTRMNDLLKRLSECKVPGITPDGEKTFTIITDSDIEGFFNRK
ncbi:MAG TPA: DNA mismatch repair endonuclease MutL [Bacteroidaceae bacterium]|nr:DNA mismatch repair endonuclease MutL [Bacteroidaceae bacterium]